ncbi:MAG TPA: ABC transporter permease subunit [Methylomirabilota bacterium]|nr:ABC transporter permease subunit [Methylomirabilota bacterium]
MATDRRGSHLLLAVPGGLVLLLFFAVPLLAIWSDAVRDPGSFRRVLASPVIWRSVRGSALLTVTAASFSLLVGSSVALHLSRMDARRRQALMFLIALPLTFSGLIVAYGFILAYGRAGFVTQALGFIGADPVRVAGVLFSPVGLAFASSYYLIPRVVLLVLPVLVNFEWTHIAAAESLGARRWRALADVMLPQILPTLVAAFCLVAAVVFGAYGTALALVGTRVSILPLQLYSMIAETGSDFPAAAALSIVLTGCCTGIMATGELVAAHHEPRDASA